MFMPDTTPVLADYLLGELSKVTKDVFFAFDITNNKFLLLNSPFEKVFNLSCETVLEDVEMLFNIVNKDDQQLISDSLVTLRDTKQKQNFDFRIRHHNQPLKWIRTNVYLYQHDISDIIIGTATDITSERQYYKTIYKLFEQKNTLLDIMSHELSAPLATINMAAQALIEHVEDSNNKIILQLLEIITETSKNGISLIKNFFDKELIEVSNKA